MPIGEGYLPVLHAKPIELRFMIAFSVLDRDLRQLLRRPSDRQGPGSRDGELGHGPGPSSPAVDTRAPRL
jgi:hypothetical protein